MCVCVCTGVCMHHGSPAGLWCGLCGGIVQPVHPPLLPTPALVAPQPSFSFSRPAGRCQHPLHFRRMLATLVAVKRPIAVLVGSIRLCPQSGAADPPASWRRRHRSGTGLLGTQAPPPPLASSERTHCRRWFRRGQCGRCPTTAATATAAAAASPGGCRSYTLPSDSRPLPRSLRTVPRARTKPPLAGAPNHPWLPSRRSTNTKGDG